MDYLFSDKISSLQPSAIREILKAASEPGVISLAAGNPAPEAFPREAIAAITAEILTRRPTAALQYGISEGYEPLRQAVTALLKQRHGVGRDFDQVIVTSGAQQAIDLTTKILCNEGDVVICENPSFIGALNTFRSYNVRLRGIEMEDDGLNLTQLEEALREEKRARFIYLIANFHNPTGLCTSLAKRREIYALAKRRGVLILEDNPYGDLRFAGRDIPSLKSFDEDGLVVYAGSFSKTIAPGLRVGFACLPAALASKMTVAKQGADVHTGALAQMICERFLAAADLDGHFHRLREIYRRKSGLMLDALSASFPAAVTWTRPEGGLFIWCTLPPAADALKFCRAAAEAQVAVVPGDAFLARPDDHSRSFRLNFSTPTDAEITRGVEILAGLLT
ncbi:MAG: PLP-dependent aminotransferase family protein [Gracilibacteraceae bacterium]|jgi:2-aminoadipate transaminase|nr:PLP-dependent aminotransferase family protein [Gracilibacteraceae bacterium]